MELGLPSSLWKGEPRQTGSRGTRKAVDKMERLNIALDPGKTGRDAQSLEAGLRRMIVGQDEAIQQIVNIYQMNQTGLNPPGPPDRQLPVSGTDRLWQDSHRRGDRRSAAQESARSHQN